MVEAQIITNSVTYAIIPTVLIPLTVVSVGVSVAATFIAGLFGVTLRSDGPKRLLELLLKPKIILSALTLNIVILGCYYGYQYFENKSEFVWLIKKNNPINLVKENMPYANYLSHQNNFSFSTSPPATVSSIKTIWTIKLPKGPFRSAAIGSNSLFYGTNDMNTYELNQDDGSVIRKFYIGTVVSPNPIIWNNQLIMGEGSHHTHHARIYAFDLNTSQYLRSYETKGHTEASPTIATHNGKELMFLVAGSDGLHAVDPNTMKKVWHANDGHIDASILEVNGNIYAATGREKGDAKKHKSYAVSYEFENGAIRWKRELPASSWMKPTYVDNNICFIMGEIYFPSKFGGLSCFDEISGEPTANFRTLTPIVSRPVTIGKFIYTADLSGNVCKFNIPDNKKEWCYQSGSKSKALTSVSYDPKRNLVIYPSTDTGLHIINPLTGKLIYHWFPSEQEGSWNSTYAGVTVTPSGWYTADKTGLIRKIRPM